MPFGGLGVLERSLLGEWARCRMDRARRRWGGSGGGTLIAGDTRDDAREDATMALESASSLIPVDSFNRLDVLDL
jgi:hypothetical protein